MLDRLRATATGWALRRARHTSGTRAARWYTRAVRWTPRFSHGHEALVHLLLARGDREGALATAQQAVHRFATNPDAWVLLGKGYEGMFRTRDALISYEQALTFEERPDAAMAAGRLYRQMGDPVNAGARFARAYAAGAGPEALKANAEMLRKAGDDAAADDAERRWRAECGA